MADAMRMRTVGVLGGMGPEATVLFLSRVIAMTPARDDSDHVPMLVDNNTQVPSRIRAIIEKAGEDPGRILVAMARRLAEAGAEALAMPCNTAHHYAPMVKRAVAVPFLDMIELSADHIARLCGSAGASTGNRVGMLASPAVRMTEVFDRALAARGLQPVYPLQEDAVLTCIKTIKATGRNAAADSLLRTAAIDLAAQQVDIILVACSELSLISDVVPGGVPLVDTVDVLAEAVIAFSHGRPVGTLTMGKERPGNDL